MSEAPRWSILAIVALCSCTGARSATVGSAEDGALIDEQPCPLPKTYDKLIADYQEEFRGEFVSSHLETEFAAHPLTAVFPAAEYTALQTSAQAGRCKRIPYRSDGLRITGFVLRPAVPPPGKLPAILYARGGNRDFGRIDERLQLSMQLLADEGYVVLATQLRNADGGEGRDEYGGADVHDLANLVPLARAMADIDLGRLYLNGGSRGGMEAFLALRAGLPVRAAAIRAPSSDLRKSTKERPEMAEVFTELIPGYAADPDAAIRQRSAVLFADQIRAPVLLLQAREDWRVPLAHTEALDAALTTAGVPHKLIIFDRDIHQLVLHRVEEAHAIAAWFREHDGGPMSFRDRL